MTTPQRNGIPRLWRVAPAKNVRRCPEVSVYQFEAVLRENPNEHREGTIVARNLLHARDLLYARGMTQPRLKQVTGLAAFLKKLTADIR